MILPGQGGLLVVHFAVLVLLPAMEPLLHWDALCKKNKILSLLFYFHSFWNKDIQGFNLYDLSLSSATFFSIFGISPFFIDLLSKTSCQNVQNPSIFSVNCSFADSHSQGNAEIFFYS